MSSNEITQTGNVTMNHSAHVGFGNMFSRAIIFCGDAIGDAIPPIFEERAIPKIRAFANGEP
ncbi:hypothetical protein NEOLI_002903 [Neolecta irregularis DAH-3]|uniref:Uncharacterized protein n=1 Tax=Neolecta irregularis (strain DAH-3) TaxID=1198029 RepID=A0A1U7LSS4_NEOID|nr:hypothetical protein NEOLI_002903 [Neolecta irregularis DAH-3]|eukprot:OLL25726.1 hypothetical protein NEOLI_002903 [Neolecta irregularis DAH-3]